mmetsp:Transcript_14973/g.23176  ORF Transcript_14973/g.23176 Transcript_14973/m.23176 type:complete len:97 (+) Transcript_14973:2891-3181(+)
MDIQYFTDESETYAKQDGTDYGYIYSIQNGWPFKSDSQILHVLDCTTYYNEISKCERPTASSSHIDSAVRDKDQVSYLEYSGDKKYRLFVYETRIV